MSSHAHKFATWKFSEPVDAAAISCVHVLEGNSPVVYGSHDEHDAPWLFLCEITGHESKDGRVVCLGCMVERDSSLAQLADLPVGWCAERLTPDGHWVRKRETQAEGEHDA
jgi:hypothetical protein